MSTMNFQMFKLDLEKAEKPEIKLPTSTGSSKKHENSRKTSTLLQHHSSKALILWYSGFFMAQLSHPYMTTRKTTALTKWIFVSKVMALLFNTLSRFVVAFLPRSKRLLISWLQSPSTVILEPKRNKVSHCFHCFPVYLP